MSQTIEVKVPDIGDFKDVAVIEVFVKAGEKVEAEQSLITLETDKAAMEVPSPAAGVVKELKVKVGDKVSEGSVILTLESSSAVVTPAAKPAASAPTPAAASNKSPTPTPLSLIHIFLMSSRIVCICLLPTLGWFNRYALIADWK